MSTPTPAIANMIWDKPRDKVKIVFTESLQKSDDPNPFIKNLGRLFHLIFMDFCSANREKT